MGALDTLLDHPALWRGRSATPAPDAPVWPSGHAELDRALGGGWPRGQLVELLGAPFGCGETRLLVPMLTACGQDDYWIAVIAPPATPWLPGWQTLGIPPERVLLIHTEHDRDTLWAGEQCLRDPAFGVLLAWLRRPVETALLRRLRLAASESRACAVLYRPPDAAAQPSPAHQRLRWQAAATGLELHCLKGAGHWARSGQPLWIPEAPGA
ncbi:MULTISPECIES: translesion DNA synthesis-associated protein ImuA [unclassified Thioalkalivibrio]|uniref:translesion DNA synthesis-associated protein ImuA n=1 Tax=unclassified Thioalkalivibrio TaxID=2621013 RepID=UPI000382EDE8|nr:MULTISPECIES: translesion DNA synthesis-associated protein ImuA [unclassified Thioalkalivibrio]